MIQWNTTKILEVLKRELPDCKFIVEGQGGDYDTETIAVTRKNWTIYVVGFRTDDEEVTDPANSVVDVVLAAESTKEGMSNGKPEHYILYGNVASVLKDKFGFTPEPKGYKSFF